MALPYQEIDWTGSLAGDVKGKKLGLLLEAGVGLKPQPAVRRAIEAAGKAFARAGAVVEPVAPFLTRDMLDGLDRFFQARLFAEYELAAREAKGQGAAVHRRLVPACREARPPSMRCVRSARSF